MRSCSTYMHVWNTGRKFFNVFNKIFQVQIKLFKHKLLFATTLILNTDTSPCSEEEVLCPLGTALTIPIERCIPGSFVCDGVEDCIGGTDEEACSSKD